MRWAAREAAESLLRAHGRENASELSKTVLIPHRSCPHIRCPCCVAAQAVRVAARLHAGRRHAMHSRRSTALVPRPLAVRTRHLRCMRDACAPTALLIDALTAVEVVACDGMRGRCTKALAHDDHSESRAQLPLRIVSTTAIPHSHAQRTTLPLTAAPVAPPSRAHARVDRISARRPENHASRTTTDALMGAEMQGSLCNPLRRRIHSGHCQRG